MVFAGDNRSRTDILSSGGTNLVRVVSGSRANTARLGATITKENRNGIIRMTRLRPYWAFDLAPADSDFDYILRVGLMIAICVLIQIGLIDRARLQNKEAHALGHRRAHEDHIVPGMTRQRLRSFLQPAIIDERS